MLAAFDPFHHINIIRWSLRLVQDAPNGRQIFLIQFKVKQAQSIRKVSRMAHTNDSSAHTLLLEHKSCGNHSDADLVLFSNSFQNP